MEQLQLNIKIVEKEPIIENWSEPEKEIIYQPFQKINATRL